MYNEDLWEDSASRSYYAMFHAARAALIQIGVSTKTHEGTVSEFGRRLVLNETFPREMGRAFADAKSSRETYEYSTVEEITGEEAKNLLENAEKFVSLVETFLRTFRGKRFDRSLTGFNYREEIHEASRYLFTKKTKKN